VVKRPYSMHHLPMTDMRFLLKLARYS